jgi:putative ATPase
MQAVHMVGMPEAQLILAQTAAYLASCPKSIASTTGIFEALNDIDEENLSPIPLHLRMLQQLL